MNPMSSSCCNCTTKIGFLQRKRLCCECSHVFCSSCLPKEKGGVKRKCGKCKILSAHPLDRNTVMNLRVCDLKWFLKSTSVSMFACTEKSELVDLVMQHAPNVATNTSNSSASSYHYDRDGLVGNRLSSNASQNSSSQNHRRSHSSSQQEPAANDSADSRSCPTSPRSSALHRNSESCSSLKNQGINDPVITSSLDDLKGPDQIAQLSTRQLKLILVRNFVDYKGCCEKLELQDRVLRLWNQKQERETKALVDENLCKICWESQIDCVMLECGHMATCTPCGKQMNECPICRQYVVRVVHTFKA